MAKLLLYNKEKTAIIFWLSRHAPVAQWIEHRIPVPRVGGSSPFRRTKKADTHKGVCFFGISEERTRKGDLSEAKVRKCPVDTFLGRGKIPRSPGAVRRTVNGDREVV